VPSIIIIAGPNGAGKTTFGDEYLSIEERRFEFVNADEIARGLDAQGIQASSDVLAARMMLRRVDELVQANADFVVETTLASLALRSENSDLACERLRRLARLSPSRLTRRSDDARSETRGRRWAQHSGRYDPSPL
jgi:predicted ABC-type ATPase